jgi:UDPglucose--hexose-1-phosphate uridylyltransferase
MMYRRRLRKPDGRGLLLYARGPLDESLDAPSPPATEQTSPHLRWHPLRREWVAYAGARQLRTFMPAPDQDPLAPTTDPRHPTEVPAGRWDIAVFDNRFPALTADAGPAPMAPVPTRPAHGACEVVVFTQRSTGSLGALALDHLELLVEVWADRTRELGARADVEYVLPFENRGVEVGVTLPHPHGQIYGYPFVPPVAERELEAQRAYRTEHGTGLLEAIIAAELTDERRLVHVGPEALAFAPACARFPYEVWVAPRRPVARFDELDGAERRDVARALKVTLLKLDALWDRPMPYVLAFHQGPTDGAAHPEAHLHAEITPFARMPGRLKYLAGSEVAAGVFVVDVTPEQAATELAALDVDLGAAA